jgi:glyoxylase-like metal-dependent hydrolase (beta-lactamase superfamily II)
MATLRVFGMPLGAYQTNAYVVWDGLDPTKGCWIIDPGDRPARLIDRIRAEGLVPDAVLFTHAHVDHIAGLPEVLAAFGDLPRLAHPSEHEWFGEPALNLSEWGDRPLSVVAPTGTLADGQRLRRGGLEFVVQHLPGHSPGGCSFRCPAAGVAIVGDTLFAGSIGRVDFPTSDPVAMRASLARLMEWPDATTVHAGHGPSTTIGQERAGNPFIVHPDSW